MADVMYARDVVRLVKFYQKDNDHVLRRRFHRLHLYNLYQKHNRLVELDKKLLFLESTMKPDEDGKVNADAQQQALSLNPLIKDIESALLEFGTPELQ
jgi:hypothetical protein